MSTDKQYTVVRTHQQLSQMLSHIEDSTLIAYDIETTGLNPRRDKIIGFSVSGDIGVGYYLPTQVWDHSRQQLEPLSIENHNCDDIAKALIAKLRGKKLIMHNGSFDVRFTKAYYDIDLREDLYCDTLLLHHTLYEEGPFGLKAIAIELQHQLGLDAEKEANEEQVLMKQSIKANGGSTSKDNYELFKADMDLLGQYACADTDLTLRVLTHHLPILKQQGLWQFFFDDEVMPLYKTVTIQMEEVGTELDLDLINKTKQAITLDLCQLESEIVSELLSFDVVKQWVIGRACQAFPPKKRGRFREYLISTTPVDQKAVDLFLQTGNPEDLNPHDSVSTSLALWRKREGGYLNIGSKQQLAEICFKYLGIKPQSQTRKGSDQFNDDLIEELSKQHTWAAKLRDYNKLTKINSTYIDRFLEGAEQGRYYWYFKQAGTTSGRFSSDCQQIPRHLEQGEVSDLVRKYNNILRSFLKAESGRKLVICDQSSLEPRVFASVSNDPNLINVFLDNEDLYSRVAIQAFKLKGLSAKKEDPNYVKKARPELRQRAKSIALAIPYGAGAWQIGQSLGIHPKKAQLLINDYLDGFPELAKWMSDTHIKAQTQGFVQSRVGRIRHLARVKEIYSTFEDHLLDPRAFRLMKDMCKSGEELQQLMQLRAEYKNLLNNSKNFQIQSLAASIMNRSAIAIHRDFKQQNLDAHIMLQIHDEFVINCAAEDAEKVMQVVKNRMETTVQIPTGLVAEPNVADHFGEGHL